RNFIAEAEHTAGLQADDGHAALDVRCEPGERAFSFLACFVHLADGKERAAAAQWPRRTIGRLGEADPIAAGVEHGPCGIQILSFEVAVESVSKKHDLWFIMPGLDLGI